MSIVGYNVKQLCEFGTGFWFSYNNNLLQPYMSLHRQFNEQ